MFEGWLAMWAPWWPDLAAFLRMGKHGVYVWPAFGLCALALALEWWWLARAPASHASPASPDRSEPESPPHE